MLKICSTFVIQEPQKSILEDIASYKFSLVDPYACLIKVQSSASYQMCENTQPLTEKLLVTNSTWYQHVSEIVRKTR